MVTLVVLPKAAGMLQPGRLLIAMKRHGKQQPLCKASTAPVLAASCVSNKIGCKVGTATSKLCTAGNACVTDKGVASLAEAPAVVLQQLQELVLDAVQCTWEGIQLLLNKCTGLHKLELFGISAS